MKKIDIAFIVLHYMVEEFTIKAIHSIEKNIDTENYMIVLVDNASPNSSGKYLDEYYKKNNKVEVIINDKNMGFAKGNNVGYQFLKNNYDCEFIVMMNNDIIVIEKQLNAKLKMYNKKYEFDVAGPLIMTGDGVCNVNPIRLELPLKKQIKKEYLNCKINLWLYKSHTSFLLKGRNFFYRLIRKKTKNRKQYLDVMENVQLHGCFMIFSKKYINSYDGLDERTYMYLEEEVLYAHMLGENRKTVYLPDILIYHHEDAATDVIIKNNKKKVMFVLKNQLASYEILLELYNRYRFL